MRRILVGLSCVLLVLATVAAPSLAQVPVNVPGPSPKASVMQVLGVTEMTVTYCRPAVRGRKIWGALVPYGQVWRAGANENTVVSFSTPVKVQGKPLAAGTYGLHTIPGEKEWIVILSSQHRAWGSDSYDSKEDALRVTVAPQPAEHAERLVFTFDDVTNASATLALSWEKLRVGVKIEADVAGTVTADLRDQLRGLPRYDWQGWNQAAAWLLNNGGDLDQALAWAEKSIELRATGTNFLTKAALLEKKGDKKGAAEARAKADEIATEVERNLLGYQHLQAGHVDEAIATFQKNVKAFPGSWNAWDSLAEGYAVKGDKKAAIENYTKAHGMVKIDAQKKRIEGELAKLR